jgi:ketosteroid isomerase-like protein
MSKKLIIELFYAVDRRDWGSLRYIFHPEIIYERPGYEPLAGIDRVLHFYEHERIVVSGTHHTECIIVDGNNGACWGRFVGLKKDNSQADERYADIYLFENGMIKTRKTYFFRSAI